jgi:hypothetical protein
VLEFFLSGPTDYTTRRTRLLADEQPINGSGDYRDDTKAQVRLANQFAAVPVMAVEHYNNLAEMVNSIEQVLPLSWDEFSGVVHANGNIGVCGSRIKPKDQYYAWTGTATDGIYDELGITVYDWTDFPPEFQTILDMKGKKAIYQATCNLTSGIYHHTGNGMRRYTVSFGHTQMSGDSTNAPNDSLDLAFGGHTYTNYFWVKTADVEAWCDAHGIPFSHDELKEIVDLATATAEPGNLDIDYIDHEEEPETTDLTGNFDVNLELIVGGLSAGSDYMIDGTNFGGILNGAEEVNLGDWFTAQGSSVTLFDGTAEGDPVDGTISGGPDPELTETTLKAQTTVQYEYPVWVNEENGDWARICSGLVSGSTYWARLYDYTAPLTTIKLWIDVSSLTYPDHPAPTWAIEANDCFFSRVCIPIRLASALMLDWYGVTVPPLDHWGLPANTFPVRTYTATGTVISIDVPWLDFGTFADENAVGALGAGVIGPPTLESGGATELLLMSSKWTEV